jgi:hypothetical protein
MTRRLVAFVSTLVTSLMLCVVVADSAAAETTYTWVGNSQTPQADNHSWSDQRNWDPTGVPADGDSVVIAQPSQGDCFAHVDNVPTVSLTNFTLEENPSLCTTSVSGGAITVEQMFQWNGGALETPVTVAGGAAATVTGTNQRLNSLVADLDVLGVLSVGGTVDDGALRISGGTTLHIEPGASLVSGGPNEIDGATCCTNPPVVRNEGTISVNGSTLTLTAVELDQQASVVTTLDGQLVTDGAVVTTAASTDYSGNGSWLLEERTAARFGGTVKIGNGFRIDFGGINSVFSSSLGGTADLTGHGTFAWTGGVIEANLNIGHSIRFEVSGAHTGGAGRVLEGLDTSGTSPVPVTQTNHGAISIGDGATITTAGSARLTNASDGLVQMEPGTAMSAQGCCASPDRFVNSGVLSVLPTTNSGPVVLTGISYRSQATTEIASGRTLKLIGGAPGKLDDATINGGGHLAVNTPVAVDHSVKLVAPTKLVLGDHGSLDGDATFGGAGSIGWTAGTLSGHPVLGASGGTAISGPDQKVVANIGGGSTPSQVRLDAPTTIAAGTSNAHDVINLGASTLVLAAHTTAGAFTDFSGGTVDNADKLTINADKVFARNLTQRSSGTLDLDRTSSAHGTVQVLESATMHGKISVHNSARPRSGATMTVLKANILSGSLACVTTSGSGSAKGHWAAKLTADSVKLTWRKGKAPHC